MASASRATSRIASGVPAFACLSSPSILATVAAARSRFGNGESVTAIIFLAMFTVLLFLGPLCVVRNHRDVVGRVLHRRVDAMLRLPLAAGFFHVLHLREDHRTVFAHKHVLFEARR